MTDPNRRAANGRSRRSFLRASSLAAGALVVPHVHAAGESEIKVALVGCGGRGGGAAVNVLSTGAGPTRIWALADVFGEKVEGAARSLSEKFGERGAVPGERRFVGFDGYRRAIDSLGAGGLVLLATPPAFRPMHFEYAVSRGVNVFMEKSFGVDAPGIRRVLAAGEAAKGKGLKVAGGLMCRHNAPLEEAVRRIHDGVIGEVITCWPYREHGAVGFSPRRPGETEMAHQVRNYSNFTWLNGSFLVDWLIHNIDVCCWVKNGWPVSAQGMGGRQCRVEPDQLFDHYAAEFTFADGTRMMAQGRHMNNCWNFFGSVLHGAKGSAVLGEGIERPAIYKGYEAKKADAVWEFKGQAASPYQREMDSLVGAIVRNEAYDETRRCAMSCMTAIMGRMAVESGQRVTFEQAMGSKLELAPGIEGFSLDCATPMSADEKGRYPVAMPGVTKVI